MTTIPRTSALLLTLSFTPSFTLSSVALSSLTLFGCRPPSKVAQPTEPDTQESDTAAPDSPEDTAPDAEMDRPDPAPMVATQGLNWAPDCVGVGVDCAVVEVPYDYAAPEAGTMYLLVARKVHTGPDAKGVILVNVGGPGEAGTPHVGWIADDLAEANESYDIVSWDPRGTGQSERMGCASAVDTFDAVLDALDGRTATATLGALLTTEVGFLEACRSTNPHLVDHMGMNTSADDIDTLRVALGEEAISYYGMGQGAALGLAYGERHAGRVDYMVLDSSVSPFGGMETLYRNRLGGLAGIVEAWAEWCSADARCLVHEDPTAAMAAVLDRATHEPLTVDGRTLSWVRAAWGMSMFLYDEARWPDLAPALAAALGGDGGSLLSASDAYTGRTSAGYDPMLPVTYHGACTDSAVQRTAAEIAAAAAADEAQFGAAGGLIQLGALETTFCTAFGPGVDPVDHAPTAEAAPPYLMLHSREDAATPLSGALAVQAQLTNGTPMVIVERATQGAMFASECARQSALDYFDAGILPADGTSCD